MAVPPVAGLTFRRSQRVKANRDFQRAKTKGRRLRLRLPHCELDLLAPKPNHARRFCDRQAGGYRRPKNRARRLLREAFRRHQHALAGPIDLILVARRSIQGLSFDDVEKDFLTAARRAGILKETPA